MIGLIKGRQMTLLPKEKSTVDKNASPGRLFIYGPSKCGKTTALSRLPENLIVDLEEGSRYLECFAVNIVKQLREDPNGKMKTPIGLIRLLLKELTEQQPKQFKSITFDTADWLEIFMGREIERQEGVSDYRDLEYGKGYSMVRDSIIKMLDAFTAIGLNVIVIAHRKKTTMST
jgi:GTPase SAR1 family protein